jgi:hypothetical protein
MVSTSGFNAKEMVTEEFNAKDFSMIKKDNDGLEERQEPRQRSQDARGCCEMASPGRVLQARERLIRFPGAAPRAHSLS